MGCGDGTSNEGVRLTGVCSTATEFGGEVDALDLGGVVYTEVSRVERCFIVAEASILPS